MLKWWRGLSSPFRLFLKSAGIQAAMSIGGVAVLIVMPDDIWSWMFIFAATPFLVANFDRTIGFLRK